MADAKDPKKSKGAKPSGRAAKKDSGKAPQVLDDGSEESKFQPRLRDTYRDRVVPALMKEFGYKNIMQVPKLERIVLNVGFGDLRKGIDTFNVGMSEAIQNVKLLESAATELGTITGQKAVVTRAKKAIAGFKLRQGMPIGTKVTLRNRRMYEFFDRLVTLALPRIRDFRGVSPKAFDGRGNYTLGLKEQLIFPEIQYDEVGSIHGMDITIVTTARTNDEGKALLTQLGMPFRT
jgi:large subunit ribosomal protein L5